MTTKPEALVLFSGGLDSILAARLIMDQGLAVRCVHFTSPFFGKLAMQRRWKQWYGLDVHCIDIGPAFVEMLAKRPEHGFGKVLNPCVDCKILMMRTAKKLMEDWGASFLVSGEVLGQRPMSQRRDTLNIIHNEAGVKGLLVRPLCARHLEPTRPEQDGRLDRNLLLDMQGRGRRPQLELARQYGFTQIPSPGGGCKLAEKENAQRYWAVLSKWPELSDQAFHLANIGRQMWAENEQGVYWLAVGRHEADTEAILALAPKMDAVVFKTVDFSGPMALAPQAAKWSQELLLEAAALVASYSPKAVAAQRPVLVRITKGEQAALCTVTPQRESILRHSESNWPQVRECIRAG